MISNYTLFSDYRFTLLDGAVVLCALLQVTVFILALFVAIDYLWTGDFINKENMRRQRFDNKVNNHPIRPQPEGRSALTAATTEPPLQARDKPAGDGFETWRRPDNIATVHGTFVNCLTAEVQQNGPSLDDVSVADVIFGDIKIPSSSNRSSLTPTDSQPWVDICNDTSGDDNIFFQYEEAYNKASQMTTFFKPKDIPALHRKQKAASFEDQHVNAAFDCSQDTELDGDESFNSGRSYRRVSVSSGIPHSSEMTRDYRGHTMIGNHRQEVSVDTGLPVTEQEMRLGNCDSDSVKEICRASFRLQGIKNSAKIQSNIVTVHEDGIMEVTSERTNERIPIKAYPCSTTAKAREFTRLWRQVSASQSHKDAFFPEVDLEAHSNFESLVTEYGGIEMCVDSGRPLTMGDLRAMEMGGGLIGINNSDMLVVGSQGHVAHEFTTQVLHKTTSIKTEAGNKEPQDKDREYSVAQDGMQMMQGGYKMVAEFPSKVNCRGGLSRHGEGRNSMIRGTKNFTVSDIMTHDSNPAASTGLVRAGIIGKISNSASKSGLAMCEDNIPGKRNSTTKQKDGFMRGRYDRPSSSKRRDKSKAASVKENLNIEEDMGQECIPDSVRQSTSYAGVSRRSFETQRNTCGKESEEQFSRNKPAPGRQRVIQEGSRTRPEASHGRRHSHMLVNDAPAVVKIGVTLKDEVEVISSNTGAKFDEGLDNRMISAMELYKIVDRQEVVV